MFYSQKIVRKQKNTVLNIPLLIFVGYPTNRVITGNMSGDWDPELLVAMFTAVGLPLEEALADVGTNSRRVMFRLDRDCKVDFISSLG